MTTTFFIRIIKLFRITVMVSGAFFLSSCGGGGGGGGSAPVVSYGALEGYVFAPYGSGRVAAAPAGYKPLSGATVTVKKNLSEKSATTSSTGYFKITSLNTGTYSVTVSKSGYGNYQTSAVVKADETRTIGGGQISMLPTSRGSLVVTANVAGGTVILDGENTGLSIPESLSRMFDNASTGVHAVSISQTGFEGGTAQNVTVSSGETASVDFFMMPSGNRAPVASVQTDGKGFVGFEYPLNGRGSSDPDGDSLTYTWAQVSGPSATLSSSNESSPTITPSASSTYKFRLTVSDGYLTDSMQVDFSAMRLTGRIVGELYQSNMEVYILFADGSEFVNITNNTEYSDFQPRWSPNGRNIIYYTSLEGNGVYEINDDGTEQRKVVPDGSSPLYTSNGQQIIYVKNNSIYQANIDGTQETILVSPGSNYTGEISLSKDGSKIAFSGEFGTWNREVMTINLDGSEYKRLTNNDLSENRPQWLPDGRIVFGSSFQSTDRQLYIMDANGGNITKLCNDNVIRNYHVLSTDGNVVYYYYGSFPNYVVYAMHTDCKGATAIFTGSDFIPEDYTPYE